MEKFGELVLPVVPDGLLAGEVTFVAITLRVTSTRIEATGSLITRAFIRHAEEHAYLCAKLYQLAIWLDI